MLTHSVVPRDDGRQMVLLYEPHVVSPSERTGATYRAMPPLSLLALAGPLRDAGYAVRIIDQKWEADWRGQVRACIDRVVCVGVTSLTGPSVQEGLEFSSFVKELRPELPVVWGGWHSTFAADQAIDDPRIDIVVRGIGERTFVEVVQAIEAHGSLREILGIHFREAGTVVKTPDRPAEDVGHFPPPAYELITPERYILEQSKGVRLASTIFSRGCPYSCDFCLDSRQRVLALPIDRMMTDIEFWLDRGANLLRFYDGNFFLGKSRITEFCEAVLARALESRCRWIATAVGKRIALMDDDLLALLKRAGLAQVALGAESGSDELLSRITNKTTVETTVESVRRLTRHGINQYLFFMVGYPDEPADALEKTLDLATAVKKINPEAGLFLNFTTPLPGSEVFRLAVAKGEVEPPRRFEDWARFDYLKPNLLNITNDYKLTVSRFKLYLHYAYPPRDSMFRRSAAAPLRTMARWRVSKKYFDFPVELAAVRALTFAQQTGTRGA